MLKRGGGGGLVRNIAAVQSDLGELSELSDLAVVVDLEKLGERVTLKIQVPNFVTIKLSAQTNIISQKGIM